jgi:RNA polymerase sigma-70 factor (ECF subfamily)
VAILKIYDQKTFYEISEILGISPNTCASRYRYAMDKLREALKGLWP